MRYFVTTSAQFSFGGPLGAQAANVHARIYVDSVLKAVVGLGNGVAAVESPPGTWTYHVVDKELAFGSTPSPGDVSVQWFAQDGINVNADVYPTITTPTLDTVASADTIDVVSTTPTNNATGVSTRNAMVVEFDQPIDSNNLETSLIHLRLVKASKSVPTKVYVNTSNTTQLIIKASSDLAETALYELFIDRAALYAVAGYQMSGNYVLRFTTGADDFQTVHEATSEGVIDRVAPIILAGPSTLPLPASVTLAGASPPAGSINVDDDEFVFTFSEDLDPLVLPTIDIQVESVIGLNEFYYVNNSFWGKMTPPTMPTIVSTVIVDNTVTVEMSGPFPGNAVVTFTISGLETTDNDPIPPVTVQYTSLLFPFRVGVVEVKNKIRGYISEDVTNDLIAQMITSVGIDLYMRVGNKAPNQQRCVIKHEVALQLMDDYLGAIGGSMAESKTLGAFTVSRRPMVKGPPLRERLQLGLDKCWYELSSFFNSGKALVKSIVHPEERKDYRIRTWRSAARSMDHGRRENERLDRIQKMPGVHDKWS